MSDKLMRLSLKYQTKNSLVHDILKEKILNGEISQNERLIIKKVASSLGVSETPIREAIKILEAEGLVKVNPHVGITVSTLKLEELKNILEIRFNLESLATKLATEKSSPKIVKVLERKLKEMVKCVESKDFLKFGLLNREFHQTIYGAADNPYLYNLIFDLWNRTEGLRSVFFLVPSLINTSHKEHIKIKEAIARKDAVHAVKLIRIQKKRAFSALEEYFKKNMSPL